MDAITVHANSDADAIAVAQSMYDGDINALWALATVTTMAAAANMVGWRLHVKVTSPLGVDVVDITVVGAGADDTIDEIAALMVIALNATVIDGAAYNAGTQVLTIAETTDGLGDHQAYVEWFPPAADVQKDVAVPGFVVSQVDGGASGDALTVTFPADAYAVPKVYGSFRQVS
jgi:hypothetical protein